MERKRSLAHANSGEDKIKRGRHGNAPAGAVLSDISRDEASESKEPRLERNLRHLASVQHKSIAALLGARNTGAFAQVSRQLRDATQEQRALVRDVVAAFKQLDEVKPETIVAAERALLRLYVADEPGETVKRTRETVALDTDLVRLLFLSMVRGLPNRPNVQAKFTSLLLPWLYIRGPMVRWSLFGRSLDMSVHNVFSVMPIVDVLLGARDFLFPESKAELALLDDDDTQTILQEAAGDLNVFLQGVSLQGMSLSGPVLTKSLERVGHFISNLLAFELAVNAPSQTMADLLSSQNPLWNTTWSAQFHRLFAGYPEVLRQSLDRAPEGLISAIVGNRSGPSPMDLLRTGIFDHPRWLRALVLGAFPSSGHGLRLWPPLGPIVEAIRTSATATDAFRQALGMEPDDAMETLEQWRRERIEKRAEEIARHDAQEAQERADSERRALWTDWWI